MAPRPQDLDLSKANATLSSENVPTGGNGGRLTPRRPNFYMDLPSPRVGEVPPALSPLDAFALHSRALARKLEESAKAGRRMSRLPHHEIQTELAKRPGYFRSISSETASLSSDYGNDANDDHDDDHDQRVFVETSPNEDRPVSQYPYLGHVNDRFSQSPSGAPKPAPPPIHTTDHPGYFGIQVPRSSSPEPFDSQPSNNKNNTVTSPAVPSLTSSIDSIGSSHPRTLTNESLHSRAFQGGLAPPKSPLHPRSPRSIASIRSVIDSAEEDNGNPSGFERVRKSSKAGAFAGTSPYSPLSPDFVPIARSPSALSEVSVNEPLPRPSFNFSRPRSNSNTKLNVDRRPNFDSRPSFEIRPMNRKTSNGSSLREAMSVDQTGDNDNHSIRALSRQQSASTESLSRVDTRSTRGAPSRQNSSAAIDNQSLRAPSRQNSANDFQNGRGPSPMRSPIRQGSASDTRSIRGPSRQASSDNMLTKTDTHSSRGIRSRQNSGSAAETYSARALSRQNSAQALTEVGSISEADIFSGDESLYGEHGDPDDPRHHNDPRDMRGRRDPGIAGAPSYIYSKYSLPRGRTVEELNPEHQRNSWADHQFKWEEAGHAPVETKSTAKDPIKLSPMTDAPPPSLPTTPTRNQFPASSINRSRSAEPSGPAGPRTGHKSVPSSPSAISSSTDQTVRGRSHVRNSPSQDIAGLSPEEHLERGIQAHNAGSLSKSTYHLRLAARAGMPTAMLLYALACRHGWGMRPNQAEGVQWLKRAVDSSSLEFMADKDPLSVSAPGEKSAPMTPEQKTRKAQFALAIYELGMSYMNGWGIPRDKALALRCFEIAGSWGDNDALAEAGYCYTQGVGCRKDLKKAARFYRRAAEGGMSMAGNSWIYKPKYMDDPVPDKPAPAPAVPGDKPVRPPSRARGKSFFSRKKPPIVA
ncbi:hypothetical protein AAFC00_007052 [Neodothiora populina]|uniref:Cell cycle inhibitor Nif1 n=1 Tax=Neodothiora populina TaxID=2781224 RepID=A0ABR3PDB2_9PEZI